MCATIMQVMFPVHGKFQGRSLADSACVGVLGGLHSGTGAERGLSVANRCLAWCFGAGVSILGQSEDLLCIVAKDSCTTMGNGKHRST
jgi:hypothetical protein